MVIHRVDRGTLTLLGYSLETLTTMDAATNTLPMPPSPGISNYVPPPPSNFAPQAPQQQPAQRTAPVGRPNADPDVQEQRAEKHQLRQRTKAILPASMTDGKLAIFKLEGSRGKNKSSTKPAMTILFRDLETAQAAGLDTEAFVREKLIEKYGEKGRFLWEAQDNMGRKIPEAGEVEIDLGNDDQPEEDDMDDDLLPEAPEYRQQPQQHIPPPPPPFDPAVHAATVKDVLSQEKRSSESMMSVMMTMMQQQSAQAVASLQMQMQAAETRRQEEERRREREEAKEREERKFEIERLRLEQERRDKEEQRREDRERERSAAAQQMQMTLFTTMLNRPDTMTPMLMKLMDSKGDRDGMKEVFSLLGESSKQAMATQGEATKVMLSAQADASKALMGNVMTISQTMVEQMAQSQAEPTSDPMEKISRVFGLIAPALAALNGGTKAAIAPAPPQQRLPQAQPQRSPAPVPASEYIKGGLYTIMRLETGELPANQRFNALKWCAQNLPRPMLEAIRGGDEGQVITAGMSGMDERLMTWIQDEQHMTFLRGCLADIQKMLLGTITEADAQVSMAAHIAYMRQKQQSSTEAADEADTVIPQEVVEAAVAQPVEERGPDGKRRAPPPAESPTVSSGEVQQSKAAE